MTSLTTGEQLLASCESRVSVCFATSQPVIAVSRAAMQCEHKCTDNLHYSRKRANINPRGWEPFFNPQTPKMSQLIMFVRLAIMQIRRSSLLECDGPNGQNGVC
jgi:hypothetical protein